MPDTRCGNQRDTAFAIAPFAELMIWLKDPALCGLPESPSDDERRPFHWTMVLPDSARQASSSRMSGGGRLTLSDLQRRIETRLRRAHPGCGGVMHYPL